MSLSGSKRALSVRMSGKMYDRLTTISVRLKLPMSEVAVRLMVIGLDTSADLALDQPAVEGIASSSRS